MPQAPDTATGSVSLEALASRAERAGRDAPPVELWNPTHCGTLDIAIDEEGRWHHEGARIEREALVRLFSTILRREADGSFVLVTPAEKMAIRVADVPFLGVEMAVEGEGANQTLRLRTNVGDLVTIDAEHPLRFAGGEDGFRPYVLVRGGLEARLTRALAIDLAGLLEESEAGLVLRSADATFRVPAQAEGEAGDA